MAKRDILACRSIVEQLRSTESGSDEFDYAVANFAHALRQVVANRNTADVTAILASLEPQLEMRAAARGKILLISNDFLHKVEQTFSAHPPDSVLLLLDFLVATLPPDLRKQLVAGRVYQMLRREVGEKTSMEDGLVGMIDMVDSTKNIMGIDADAETRARYMKRLVDVMHSKLVSVGAQPASFTGDGLIFYCLQSDEQVRLPDRAVGATLRGLERDLESCQQSELRTITERHNIPAQKLRIALAFGTFFISDFGPHKNIVGVPVIEAARLCEPSNFNDSGRTVYSLVMTEAAWDKCEKFKVAKKQELPAEDVVIKPLKGLRGECTIRRHRL